MGLPQPPPDLPRQRRGTTPQMRGRYPDYDVLAQASHWDEPTRVAVLPRVGAPPPIRFFDEREARALGAFCDVVMAQDREPRIPVLAMVDEKLYEKRLDGYRHAELPPDPATWKLVARMLDEIAVERGAADFAAATAELRHAIVGDFADGELQWRSLPVAKAWSVVTRAIVAAFYSHPWAWNEIGFGGPAYPRGFARLNPGQRDHWERPPEFELDPVEDVERRHLE